MPDKEAAVEDETRLLYVAMTRARSQMIMSCDGIRFYTKTPSRCWIVHYPRDFSTRNLVWIGHLAPDSEEHILPVDYQR